MEKSACITYRIRHQIYSSNSQELLHFWNRYIPISPNFQSLQNSLFCHWHYFVWVDCLFCFFLRRRRRTSGTYPYPHTSSFSCHFFFVCSHLHIAFSGVLHISVLHLHVFRSSWPLHSAFFQFAVVVGGLLHQLLDLWLVGWGKRKSVGVRGMKERILREGEDLCVEFWGVRGGGGGSGEKKKNIWYWGKWFFKKFPFLMKLDVMGVRSLFLSVSCCCSSCCLWVESKAQEMR